MFQSRRDPGMALRPAAQAFAKAKNDWGFNPVVIRAWRCASVPKSRMRGDWPLRFQSRRDPGMALRQTRLFLSGVRRRWFQSRRDPGMALRLGSRCRLAFYAKKFQSRRDPGMALRLGYSD